jgi:hypothetical protein
LQKYKISFVLFLNNKLSFIDIKKKEDTTDILSSKLTSYKNNNQIEKKLTPIQILIETK